MPKKLEHKQQLVLGSVLVIIFVFLLCLFLYLFLSYNKVLNTSKNLAPTPTPTPDPTANWKTYTHPIHGYTLQYPSDLFTKCELHGYLYLENGAEDPSNCYAGEGISAFYIVHTLEGTGNFQKSEFENCYSVKQESVEIDGVKGIKYSNTLLNDQGVCNNQIVSVAKNEVHIVLYHNNVVYNIGFYEDQNKDIKNQILSTFTFLPSIKQTNSNQSTSAKPKPTIIPSPTTAIVVTQNPTSTPTQAPTSTPTATPQPPDTTPPTLDYMTGPENGSTVSFSNFCFPMKASDNKTSSLNIQTQYKFDGSEWSGWSTNYAYCFSGISNGSHTFVLEFKDEAGNTSSVQRTFTVQT